MTSGLQGSNDHLSPMVDHGLLHGASLTFFQAVSSFENELFSCLGTAALAIFFEFLTFAPKLPTQYSQCRPQQGFRTNPTTFPKDTLFFVHVSLMYNQPFKHHVSMVHHNTSIWKNCRVTSNTAPSGHLYP